MTNWAAVTGIATTIYRIITYVLVTFASAEVEDAGVIADESNA